MTDRYLIQAFDARGEWLDTENSAEGDPTFVDGARACVDFLRSVRSGILHDFDAETHERKRVAYFVVWAYGTVCVEIAVTPWGRHCRVANADLHKRHQVKNSAQITNV